MIIIDANTSMLAPYPKDQATKRQRISADADSSSSPTTTTTRFDVAKKIAQDLIGDLMVRSTTHECSVIVLKTPHTDHNLGESAHRIPGVELEYPNLVEIAGSGAGSPHYDIDKPRVELLRKIQALECTSAQESKKNNIRGDFCDGLILAAAAMDRRTKGKKFQRRIVLLTDAEHPVQLDRSTMLVMIDKLRDMDCQLQTIGLDFASGAEFDSMEVVAPDRVKSEGTEQNEDRKPIKSEEEQEETDGEETEDSGSEEEGSDDDDEEEDIDMTEVKAENEKLLLRLTKMTGGFVMAAQDAQQILKKVVGRQPSRSMKSKVQFEIAPGLSVDARHCKLISRKTVPSLKRQLVQVNPMTNSPRKNALGEEMMEEPRIDKSYWKLDTAFSSAGAPSSSFGTSDNGNRNGNQTNQDRDVNDPEENSSSRGEYNQEVHEVADGYRYGSDLVPIGALDIEGLKTTGPARLQVLGYTDRINIRQEIIRGPPSVLTGNDSRRACAAISALAKAIHETNQVGIATLVKKKDGDPILVGLWPYEDTDPLHLVMFELPFAGDVANLSSLSPLDDVQVSETSSKSQACDALIDSLMLPAEALDYRHIPNPHVRSYHKNVIRLALDPNAEMISVRDEEDDPMTTPQALLKAAEPALKKFRTEFPMSLVDKNKKATGSTK